MRPTPARRRTGRCSVAGGLLYATGTVGSNIGPALIDDHPAAVLALSSRNRNLFASVPFIDPLAYALIGFVRLLIVGVVLYYIGAWFGARALDWTEKPDRRAAGHLPLGADRRRPRRMAPRAADAGQQHRLHDGRPPADGRAPVRPAARRRASSSS